MCVAVKFGYEKYKQCVSVPDAPNPNDAIELNPLMGQEVQMAQLTQMAQNLISKYVEKNITSKYVETTIVGSNFHLPY